MACVNTDDLSEIGRSNVRKSISSWFGRTPVSSAWIESI
jgi:hypothetical protein